MTEDRFEKTIELRAPRSRVWRAISNAKDFGTWFGLGAPLELVGDFVPGAEIHATCTVGDRTVRELFCTITRVEPERCLAFEWIPYELSPGEDPAAQPRTQVELRLEDIAGGTRLVVSERGFAKLPPDKQYKRAENAQGWAIQVHAIAAHVLGTIDVRVEGSPAAPIAASALPARIARTFGDRPIHVRETTETKLVFLWSDDDPRQVEISLAAGRIAIVERPYELSAEAARTAIAQTARWARLCCELEGAHVA